MQKKPTAYEIEAAAKRVQELIRKYRAEKLDEDERKVINEDYQVGDILRIACTPATAQVVDISPHYMWVDWPWEKKIDSDSKYGWIGLEAFPIDPDSDEWLEGLFYTYPAPHHLTVGDTCLVSIPETFVAVINIIYHDPPLDIGRLPRPHTTLVVRRIDNLEPIIRDDDVEEDSGIPIELDSAAPISLEVVFRAN
ncbi:hypothetical protein MK805_02005 [Shimazuella sp. AN120528]|uniref:hypothetical protein n=1 Tax=Shimazuella soli TaxID=1892854 RepID=UPI001F0D2694|nr:hypothetical protein [Shimazuella soli]MCH5583741.1 hypothetical protein [Shimazuella soli]